MTKITLNADKRKMIADIFQNHFEQQPSKAKIDFENVINIILSKVDENVLKENKNKEEFHNLNNV